MGFGYFMYSHSLVPVIDLWISGRDKIKGNLAHQYQEANQIIETSLPKSQNITERSLKQLQPVLKRLDGETWVKLEPFHLSAFRSFLARKINFLFLQIVA